MQDIIILCGIVCALALWAVFIFRVTRSTDEVAAGMAVRFSTRRLLAITTAIAIAMALLVLGVRQLNRGIEAVMFQRYMEGYHTREEARQQVGDIVDTWPEPSRKR